VEEISSVNARQAAEALKTIPIAERVRSEPMVQIAKELHHPRFGRR
jgi:hypothetical protein